MIVDNRQLMRDTADSPTLIERSSTAKKVAAYLRERITDGTIGPGERLNELALAGELQVSRSPIREALAQLAGEGLVRVVPYRGTFVTGLSQERLRDLLDFRVALEQFAARRVIERTTSEDFDRFYTLIAKIHERALAGDFSGAVDADLHVHEHLIELAGSALLAQTYKALLGEFRLYISQTVRHYEGIDDLATEQTALLVALRAGRTSEAMSLIAAHIAHGFNHALKEIT